MVATLAGVAMLLASTGTASAHHPGHSDLAVPYDGHNPFNCELQQLGTGTSFPDPGADPFCVEYDKTQQNVTDLGLVEFLSKEPARVAAASGKCFYYQRDHWTGSIVQGEAPELWHWDGGYFFDKARGIGGAHFANLRVGGQTYDARQLPLPEQIKAFLDPNGQGGGGALHQEIDADPACVAKVDTPEEAAKVYRGPDSPATGSGAADRCHATRGSINGRQLGPLRLGVTRERVVKTLGAPLSQQRGYQRYCLLGGGSLFVGYRDRRAAGRDASRVAVLLTTSRAYAVKGVARGARASTLRRRVRSARFRFAIGSTRVYEARRSASRRLIFGTRRGKVRFLAVADPRQVRSLRQVRSHLRRALR